MMKSALLVLCLCGSIELAAAAADDFDEVFFRSHDTLAPRDEYGLLHSSKDVSEPDYAPRFHWRPLYYLEGTNDLVREPAYVAAVQRSLGRLGYYCGPVDGVWTEDVSYAIAAMQKNNSMRVTGTLTIPVRRALHLP
jgi:hypothetical protein